VRQPPTGVSSLTLSAAIAIGNALNAQSNNKTCG